MRQSLGMWSVAAWLAGCLVAGAISLSAQAQTAPKPAPGVGAPATSAKPAPRAAPKVAVSQPATVVAQAPRTGKGWQTGPIPGWVVEPPPLDASVVPAPAVGGRREQLYDFQFNYTLERPQTFVRIRSVALDTSTLSSVSQPQILFNPSFQVVVIHGVAVVREGKRLERLPDARIETMRREQRLEQLVIDGLETLLVVLADVRVGDAVEVAYTIEGQNPLFENRISGGFQLAFDVPVEVLHHRALLPAGRSVQTRSIGTELQAERLVNGPLAVLRVVRHQIPAIVPEHGTPSWHRVHPLIDYSDFATWPEVDAWARRLFDLPAIAPASVRAQAQAMRDSGKQGEDLVAEALRFVQDDIRYFSVALGESSHRPKPPEQTLAERIGDCKDKVVLLNTLLRELGFDAKPALVSVRRNKGVRQYLPSADVFDHVITRLQMGDRVQFLDATMSQQGLTLASRGQFSYGTALVVGMGADLVDVPEPPKTLNRQEHQQLWDFTRPGKPVVFEAVMSAYGLQGERWRGYAASAGAAQVAQAAFGPYARVYPALKSVGEPQVNDDRLANRFELRQRFELENLGNYSRGGLDTEHLALEMMEIFSAPPESQRKTPYGFDVPSTVDSRVVVRGPVEWRGAAPAPFEVVDPHFRYAVRLEWQGHTAQFVRRFERLKDQVNPSDLQLWREKAQQARTAAGGRLRVPLADVRTNMPEFERLDRLQRSARGWRDDVLAGMLLRNEVGVVVDTQVLGRTEAGSKLSARVLASRAQSLNLLDRSEDALRDAAASLAIDPEFEDAIEARAVALFNLGRAEESLQTLLAVPEPRRSAAMLSWLGSIQYVLGRHADAEKTLRESAQRGSGEGREFSIIWLYMAAERQGGHGKAAVAPYVDSMEPGKLPSAILRFLQGQIDRDALIRQASARPDMERLNLAEVRYFIGQHLLLQGERDEARRWFQRAVDTAATPYREVAFSRLELRRMGQ